MGRRKEVKAKAKAKMVREISHQADVPRALKAKAKAKTGRRKAKEKEKAKEKAKARRMIKHDPNHLDQRNAEDGMMQRAPLETAASLTIRRTVKTG